MLLGAHESSAGGLHEAFPRALADGAEAVQIFTKSSKMWRSKEITPDDAQLFRKRAQDTGLPVSVHASYLINLGSGPGELRERSIAAFIDELERCDLIGALHLVVHPGSNPETKAALLPLPHALHPPLPPHHRPS